MSKAGKQGNHRVPQAEPQPGFMARFALGCCVGCFVFAICGAIAHRLGYRTLAEVLTMSAFVSLGQFFVWAAVYSAQTHGVVYRRVLVQRSIATRDLRRQAVAADQILVDHGDPDPARRRADDRRGRSGLAKMGGVVRRLGIG